MMGEKTKQTKKLKINKQKTQPNKSKYPIPPQTPKNWGEKPHM